MSAATLTDREADVVAQVEAQVEEYESAKIEFAEKIADDPSYTVVWHWDAIVRYQERAGLAGRFLGAIRREENPQSVLEAARSAVEILLDAMTESFYPPSSTNQLSNAEWMSRAVERRNMLARYRRFVASLEKEAGETHSVVIDVSEEPARGRGRPRERGVHATDPLGRGVALRQGRAQVHRAVPRRAAERRGPDQEGGLTWKTRTASSSST